MISNDMLFIGLKSKRFLNKILSDKKKKDEIIEALLHKYTRLEKEMNIFNTKENTEYYRNHGNINYDKVYILQVKIDVIGYLLGTR